MSKTQEIISLKTLVNSLEAALSENNEKHKRLSFLATHDVLTGLLNRHSFTDYVGDLFKNLESGNQSEAILFIIDLTRFKEVNDTLGHEKGDLLLRYVSRKLQNAVGEVCQIFRLGGDEFAVVLRRTEDSPEEMEKEVLESLVEVFTRKYRMGSNRISVGASIGICVAPRDASNAEEMFKRADIAMYRAKKSGIHTAYRYFDHGIENELKSKKHFEQTILDMISTGNFNVHFQPKIDLSDNSICGFEALIRPKDAEGERLSSQRIIEVAEECNLIWLLGDIIIQKSFDFITTMKNQIGRTSPVAINISSVQIARSDFGLRLQNLVEQYELSYQDICLEITESTLLNKPEMVKKHLDWLHEKGAKISIDDFGTGYSSLSYLHRYPFDELKIDHCFIQEIERNEVKKNIVSGIIQLAHAIHLNVVAEGVESVEELEALRSLGCDYIQGHYYHAAMPAADAIALMKSESGRLTSVLGFSRAVTS